MSSSRAPSRHLIERNIFEPKPFFTHGWWRSPLTAKVGPRGESATISSHRPKTTRPRSRQRVCGSRVPRQRPPRLSTKPGDRILELIEHVFSQGKALSLAMAGACRYDFSISSQSQNTRPRAHRSGHLEPQDFCASGPGLQDLPRSSPHERETSLRSRPMLRDPGRARQLRCKQPGPLEWPGRGPAVRSEPNRLGRRARSRRGDQAEGLGSAAGTEHSAAGGTGLDFQVLAGDENQLSRAEQGNPPRP